MSASIDVAIFGEKSGTVSNDYITDQIDIKNSNRTFTQDFEGRLNWTVICATS